MTVNIVLFAVARELMGQNTIALEIPDQSTILELKQVLVKEFPQLKTIVDRSAFSINHEYAQDSQELPNDAEIGMIPPVSGG